MLSITKNLYIEVFDCQLEFLNNIIVIKHEPNKKT